MELNDICVIGGGGFVGRHIVHLLAARGLGIGELGQSEIGLHG